MLYRVSILIQDTKEMYSLHIYSIVKAQIFTALFPAIPNLGSSARTKRRQSGPQPRAHLSTLLFFFRESPAKQPAKGAQFMQTLLPKMGVPGNFGGFPGWTRDVPGGGAKVYRIRKLKGWQVWPSVPLGRGGHIYELNSIKLLNVLYWKYVLLIRTLEGDGAIKRMLLYLRRSGTGGDEGQRHPIFYKNQYMPLYTMQNKVVFTATAKISLSDVAELGMVRCSRA